MVRSDRNYTDVYFGRPGALIKLPYPRDGITKIFEKQTFDFLTGSGQHQVSSLAGGSRLRVLSWRALHVDNFALLERYWTGAAGSGPFVLIDPSDTNLLTPNQAGATSLLNNTSGWATSTGLTSDGTITSNSAGGTTQHTPYNSRNLRWNFTVTPATNPTLKLLAPYRNWGGIPVVPGLSYAFSAWCRPDGVVDSAITLNLILQWRTATGSYISEAASGNTSMTGWTQLSAVGVAPPTAVYATPIFYATGSTISVGASIYIDEPLFEQDTVVNGWAPGTGLRPVEMVAFSDNVPFNGRFRVSPQLSLRELAQ